MNNKVVYVKTHFKPIYSKPGMLRSLLGKSQTGSLIHPPKQLEQKGWSDCEVDGERLAKDISNIVEQLNKDGYEVLSISNIVSGAHQSDYSTSDNSSYGLGYGYSFTEGVMVLAKK